MRLILRLFYYILIETENRKDALKYKRRRRNIHPAVYNENRLKEKPIPSTQVHRRTKKTQPLRKQPSKAKSQNFSVVDTPTNLPAHIDENNAITSDDNLSSPNHDNRSDAISANVSSANSLAHIDENNSTSSDVKQTLHPNHDNRSDTGSLNDSEDEVICLSNSANLSRHRPMHFDMVSGGYSFKETVIINVMIFFMEITCI